MYDAHHKRFIKQANEASAIEVDGIYFVRYYDFDGETFSVNDGERYITFKLSDLQEDDLVFVEDHFLYTDCNDVTYSIQFFNVTPV